MVPIGGTIHRLLYVFPAPRAAHSDQQFQCLRRTRTAIAVDSLQLYLY
jgi:hypothetical protein